MSREKRLQRFNEIVECYPTDVYREYCDDGEFVDADIAQELLEALEVVISDKAPSYHDCVDDGLPECAWCIAMNAIAKAYGEKTG